MPFFVLDLQFSLPPRGLQRKSGAWRRKRRQFEELSAIFRKLEESLRTRSFSPTSHKRYINQLVGPWMSDFSPGGGGVVSSVRLALMQRL